MFENKKKRPVIILAAAVLVVMVKNLARVTEPAYAALRADSRNSGITFVPHYRALVIPTDLVVDLWGISDSNSMLDIDRCLFQIAQAFSERNFRRVDLAWRGRTRFVLSGEDFSALGKSFAAGENPVYLIRTLPEKLKDTDGAAAFSTWTGGLLGVLGRQMDDHQHFHEKWYINALRSD